MLDKQEVAGHANSNIDNYFCNMYSEEDLVHSPLCRILEVIDQRENELMVYIAEDNRCESLQLL
jgi:hypothetical protein